MKGTFDFTVQRRENRYVFVARQYGVVSLGGSGKLWHP